MEPPYHINRQPMRRQRSRSRSRERAPPRNDRRHQRPPDRDSYKPTMQHNERETDPRRLSQRRKEIGYGKNTLGYERYLKLVPKEARRHPREHPPTPDPTGKYSKRQFDGMIRAWRRRLHDWDPPAAERGLGPAVAPVIPALDAPMPPAPAPRAAPAPPAPVDDDFGPDVFAAAAPADAQAVDYAAIAAEPARAAPADDDESDDDLL